VDLNISSSMFLNIEDLKESLRFGRFCILENKPWLLGEKKQSDASDRQ
jgi:hypothetical protein